jgi:DNA-binding response OmpR family regulator
MKILLVEDDDNKRTQLTEFVSDILPSSTLTVARSLQSGIRKIRADLVDLVLLDMTLPTYDVGRDEYGGSTHAFGGWEFLKELRRFKLQVPVIVVTQFETFGSGPELTTLSALDAGLRKDFPGIYRGAVYYHAAIESWKERLKQVIDETISGRSEC